MSDTVRNKIFNLMAKAADSACTPAEASAALSAAKRLMERYGVTEAEVKNAKADDFKFLDLEGGVYQGMRTIHPVYRYCGKIVGEFTATRVYAHVDNTGDVVRVFGFDSDVELCKWILNSFKEKFEADWLVYRQFKMASKRTLDIKQARLSFIDGFRKAINARLCDWLYRENKEAAKGTALAVRSKALVVTEALKARGVTIGGSSHSGRAGPYDNAAAGAGMNSGKSAQMGAGVGGAASRVLSIGAR